uniref:Uncharacterized protein n=1 Tax=Parastrongyloides trichosuri TaxID=131310 RepID=A0A0N4ZXR1_PARTI
MRNLIFLYILIFLIVISNSLVLYHRIPKPRLICHEETPDNSTQGASHRNRSRSQIPVIPEEDSSTVMHIEHVKAKREVVDGPFLQIDDTNKVSLNNFEIVNDNLTVEEKNEIRQKIINMCQAFNANN